MRYTTQRFGEIVYLLGEFAELRNLGEVTMALYDLSDLTFTPIPLDDDNCVENTASRAGGFATYVWPSSNVTTPSLTAVQYLYIMTDSITGRVQKGKFTVGGFPDASAVGLYQQEVHITPTGTSLDPIGTMGVNGTLTFTAGGSTGTINRTSGSWITDGFVAGDYVQITGSNLNNGVVGPITLVGGSLLTIANSEQNSIVNDTDAGTEVIISKNFQFPIGTREMPTDNLYDANTIAKALDINTYHLRAGMTMTVDFNHSNWVFLGDDPDSEVVTFDFHTTDGCNFTTIGIRGDMNGRFGGTRCIIGELAGIVTGWEGVFNDCGVAGTLVPAASGVVSGLGIAARDLTGTILDMSAGNANVLIGSVFGLWTVVNMTNGIVGMALSGSVISFSSSCTAGTAQIGGVGEMNNSNAATTNITDQVLRGTRLDEHVSDLLAFTA